jgi:hypothetical protein
MAAPTAATHPSSNLSKGLSALFSTAIKIPAENTFLFLKSRAGRVAMTVVRGEGIEDRGRAR